MQKKRIVVAGAFDIIHCGHIRFLRAIKEKFPNSELIVIIARDSTIRKLKKREPIFNEKERLEIVSAIKYVDRAVLGYEIDNKSLFEILLTLKPNIVILGYDQQIDEKKLKEWCKKHGLLIEVLRFPKFNSALSSSSEVRRKIIALFKENKAGGGI